MLGDDTITLDSACWTMDREIQVRNELTPMLDCGFSATDKMATGRLSKW